MLRCPLCAGLNHLPLFGGLVRCKLCSLAFDTAGPALPTLSAFQSNDYCFKFANWNNWYSRLTNRLPFGQNQKYYFATATVRMFAASSGRHAVSVRTNLPLLSTSCRWTYGATIEAIIEPWPVTDRRRQLTLGIIAARDAETALLELCTQVADLVSHVVVALDTNDASSASRLRSKLREVLKPEQEVLVLASPLNGDFAAQRNRVQEMAPTDWVLQLDCDERLADGMLICLPQLIADAETEGWLGIAFTRRNLVDGVMSAMYPDPQLRLLRRSVRFRRAVHEYPELDQCRIFTHLGPGLIHYIEGQRLEVRENLYENMQQGAGRPYDTNLLRQPLETRFDPSNSR